MNRAITALVFAHLAILLIACSRAVAAPTTLPASISLSDWMAAIPGNKSLSDISIPGSHDSAALIEPFPGTARCQTLSIADQLSAGVRFLDIRCRHVRDAFEIYHGPIDQQVSFDGILSACLSFLKDHPSECIIVSVLQESTPVGCSRTFSQTFDTYVNQSKNAWFLKDAIPTLNESRGHLVLLRRFSGDALEGIAASAGQWRDNSTFWIGKTIRIQDQYVVTDNIAKWNAIQSLYQEIQTNPGVLFLNFTTGYRPGLLNMPSVTAVSDEINPRLIAYFQHARPGRYGITIMNFVDSQNCGLIVATNGLQVIGH